RIVSVRGDGRECISRRSLLQVEEGRLRGQRIKVLRYLRREREGQHLAVSIARPALTEDAAEAGTNDGVRQELVGHAHAWCKAGPVVFYIQVGAIVAVAGDTDVARVQVEQAAAPL